MNDDEPRYWFPAKRHGWGWGMPRTWQGWAVILSYCALLLGAPVIGRGAAWQLLVVFASTLGVLLICLRKGEPARWRWGGES